MTTNVPALRGNRVMLLTARLFMASLFAFSGLEKVFDYRGAVGFAGAFGVPFPQYLMIGAIVLELGCVVGLLTSRYCRQAAAILFGWTLALGVWFHPFWAVPAPMWQPTIDSFFHHFVMAGGLMYVMVFGAGDRKAAAE